MAYVPIPSYVEVISNHYTDVQVVAEGDGSDYNSLIPLGNSVIPTKDDLDTLMIVDIKTAMWKLIQTRRDLRKQGGVKIGNYWFHSDEPSRIQQLGLVMFGQNMPAGIMWKTMSGEFIPMTPTLAQQIFSTVATSDITVFTIAEQHRQAMMASSSPENYNYLTGWPAIYGE